MNLRLQMIRKHAAAVPLIPLTLLGITLTIHAAAQAPSGNAANGKTAYANNGCNGCHGDEAQGGMGPALAGTAKTLAEFSEQVRKPKGSMPAFSDASVADAQLADIYAYVKSLAAAPEAAASAVPAAATPAAAPAAGFGGAPFVPFSTSTPPGNAARGKEIFTSYGCYQCHGYVGQGSTQTGAVRIGPPPIPVEAFANYIRRPAGNMPPYSAKVVPDKDVADIYAYLQTIKTPPPAKDIPLLNQ